MTKRPYILIVEDDDWLAEHYIRLLKAADYRAEYVGNSVAAMESIDTKTPDALVLDVLLPGGNVLPLLHELRSHVDLAVIPVILCTNGADKLAGEDVEAYGIAVVLDKALMKPNDLVAAVKKVLP